MTNFLPLDHCLFEHEYSAGNWQDFTGSLSTVTLNLREFDGKHSAGLTLLDPLLDPAQGSGTRVLKKGDSVRVHMDNASLTSRKTATFVILKVSTTIDLKKPPGRQYLVTVQLRGKGITGVGGVGASKGVDTPEELSDVITGAPYEIGGDGYGSGRTTPIGTSTEVAYVEVASELDQILTTRDSNPGVMAFEDPDGRVQVFDSATERTGAATFTIGPDNYSDIDMRFDTDHIINVLTIKYLEKVKAGGAGDAGKATRVKEHDHTFVDAPSKAKYGPFKKTHTVHKRIDFNDYADKVFAANADPDEVPRSVRVPIRRATELLGGYEDGNYVTKKVDILSPDGLTTYTCRISRIQHTITSRRWFVDVFLKPPTAIKHRRVVQTTEVANNVDGTVLTDHLDDAAVTNDKLDDNAVDARTIEDDAVGGDQLNPAIDGTGITVTGATLESAATGGRTVIEDDAAGGVIKFYSGHPTDVPGYINPSNYAGGDLQSVKIAAPTNTPRPYSASILLQNGTHNPDGAPVEDDALLPQIDVRGHITFYGNVDASSVRINALDLDVADALSCFRIDVGDRITSAFGTKVGLKTSNADLMYAGGSNITGKVGTDFASATGCSVAFLGSGDVVIGTQAYNSGSPSSSNTQNLHAKAIHSWLNGVIMEDLAGGGTTTATIGNGGRIVRTTSSRRYKHRIRDLDLEQARAIVRAIRPRTFLRKKPDRGTPADVRSYGGLVVEELVEAGGKAVEPFVIRDRRRRPDGVHYAELVAPVAAVVADHDDRIDALEAEVARLTRIVETYINLGSEKP